MVRVGALFPLVVGQNGCARQVHTHATARSTSWRTTTGLSDATGGRRMSIMVPRPEEASTGSERVSVYRYYDRHDVLIYVGITSRGLSRNAEHNKSKDWWQYVVRQDVEHYATRDAALDRERRLIVKWTPPFNTQHNPQHVAVRRAYEHLIASDGMSFCVPRTDKQLQVEALSVLKGTGKHLPLEFVSNTSTGKYLFRTHPDHAFVAERLVFAKPMTLGRWGKDCAVLQAVERTPIGVVFVVKSPVRIRKHGASFRIKWASQKPPSFAIAAVNFTWLPTQSLLKEGGAR